jgi:hypothetical protein
MQDSCLTDRKLCRRVDEEIRATAISTVLAPNRSRLPLPSSSILPTDLKGVDEQS